MESPPADGLKKRWFIDGIKPALRRKMKIVAPASYNNAYNRAMDLESESKTAKKKKSKSSDDDDDDSHRESSNEESSKKI